MSHASFYRKPQMKVIEYQSRHKWICLNIIMETAVNLIQLDKLLDFDINSKVKLIDNLEVPFINLLIGKIHKKLRIIIDKATILSLWKIAVIVFKYQCIRSAYWALDVDNIAGDNPELACYKKLEYAEKLDQLGFNPSFITKCVRQTFNSNYHEFLKPKMKNMFKSF